MKVHAANFDIPSSTVSAKFTDIAGVFTELWKYIIPLAGIIMLVMIIFGGFEMMVSGGNPEKVASGRSRVMMGIVGFVVVFLSWFIIRAIEVIFGISILTG
ncbi:MAG: hypothetical protein ABIB61_04450 [Candidatus Shapirobacteria bacterium]